MNKPQMTSIKEIIDENIVTKTLVLEQKITAQPGQFAMLWLPGVDEKPFSFSGIGKNMAFTVKRVGPFTEKLHQLAEGDMLGFRGPYGNGFSAVGKEVCVIMGGCGAAPLLPLVKRLDANGITIILAASTRQELLFMDELEEFGHVLPVTDDGSLGRKGVATDMLAEVLLLKKFDQMYACGPEPMLGQVVKITNMDKIPCEVSLERYMKCGIGICGSCCIDGMRVCKEGPVFDAQKIADIKLGKYTRKASGARCKI